METREKEIVQQEKSKEKLQVPEPLDRVVKDCLQKYRRLIREDIQEEETEEERLSSQAENEAERAIDELKELGGLWSEFAGEPESFRVSGYHFSDLGFFTRSTWFVDKGKERLLPIGPERPIQQIKVQVFELKDEFLAVTEKELFKAVAFKGLPPEETLALWRKIKRGIKPSRTLEICYNQAYWDQEEYRAISTPGGGVQLSFFPERVEGNGLRFVGRTAHLTRKRLPGEVTLGFSQEIEPFLTLLKEMREQAEERK